MPTSSFRHGMMIEIDMPMAQANTKATGDTSRHSNEEAPQRRSPAALQPVSQ
jgi:hypothetical protein